MTYHRACIKSNTSDAICGAGTAYPSGAHEFPGFSRVRVARSLVFCLVFCRLLLVIVLYVRRFMAFDYPFGIFKLFLCI